jgi:hypothetical protein
MANNINAHTFLEWGLFERCYGFCRKIIDATLLSSSTFGDVFSNCILNELY